MNVITMIIDGTGYTVPVEALEYQLEDLKDFIAELAKGESLEVRFEAGEMSEHQYETLPEFQGF